MTVWILHFVNRTSLAEYLVLLDQESEPSGSEIRAHQVAGFEPQARKPIRAQFEMGGALPFGERLKKDR